MAESAEKPHKVAPEDQSLIVALRVRPMSEEEIILGATPVAHRVDDNMVVLMDPVDDQDDILRANRSREKQFMFDIAFDGSSTQREVYERTSRFLIPSVMSGYNGTVFAYGATGTGKTHTMLGTEDDPGIMHQTLDDLFLEMERTKDELVYRVTISYLEIYNEMIRDLLNPGSGYLDLREDSKGVQVAGLSEVMARSPDEVSKILRQGNKERTQEPTAANKTSSRSHAVLQLMVRQRNRSRDIVSEMRIGRLFLIDLAGSERAANTQNRGKRMVEGAHINRSLLALGNCINALSDKNSSKYVNFRDSKLTRLLKEALVGNCKTVMIGHISPASVHFEESRNTLVYADRAKGIKTKVRKNVMDVSYHIVQYTNIIGELREEIRRLKQKLDNKSTIHAIQSELLQTSHKEEQSALNQLKQALLGTFNDQMELRKSLMEINSTGLEISLETTKNQLTVKKWEREKGMSIRRGLTQGEDNEFRADSAKRLELEGETEDPEEVKVAREELGTLARDKSRTDQLRLKVEKELLAVKGRASKIEELLPKKINSSEQQEVLRLLCRVHQLEVDNMEAHTVNLLCNFELRKRDMFISHAQQHRSLCDELIQHQRALLDSNHVAWTKQLEEMYELYQQEAGDDALDADLTLPDIHLYKNMSTSNLSRKNEGVVSEANSQGSLTHLPQITGPNTGANSVARKNVLNNNGGQSNSQMLKHRNDSLFAKSSLAKEINAAQTANHKETSSSSSSLINQPPPDQARQKSILTLSSRSNNTTPTPPRHATTSEEEVGTLASRETISVNTRSIAALAAKRKTQANDVVVVMGGGGGGGRGGAKSVPRGLTPYEERAARNDNRKFALDSENYLSQSRLEQHNKKYGSSGTLHHLLNDDSFSNISEAHVFVPDKSKQRRNLYRNPAAAKKQAQVTKKKSSASNYQQLSKVSPRKAVEIQASVSSMQSAQSKRSRIPAPQRRMPKVRRLPPGFQDAFYRDDPKQFESPGQTPPSTTVPPKKVKGTSLLNKGKGVTSYGSPSDTLSVSSSPKTASSSTATGQPTISGYRKGDISITGYSLQH